MPAKRIVQGQYVQREKLELAERLRREMTAHERLLWEKIRARRLGGLHFRRQQVIDGFVVDFYCHAAALVIEIDGPIHEAEKEYDGARSHVIMSHGLTLLRILNDDIDQCMPDVLNRIAAAAGVPIRGASIVEKGVSPGRLASVEKAVGMPNDAPPESPLP